MAQLGLTPVSGVSSLSGALERAAETAKSEGGADFGEILAKGLEEYRQVDNGGDHATLDLLSGNVDDLSTVLVATQKAEIALNLTVAVRNKAMEAYKEIMSMQI
ncbi:Flagellar hook-basal body complex protein FliE [bioreactor metagenome]|uniref:Flagellar hook-basal body complex protein FliE n=1 Tax=bioreactor metagenome TaxID=1076179 RepID=A0A645FKX7_9ZZZZ